MHFKQPRHQSGKIAINRVSIPFLFVITGKNINNRLQINHELGFIIDQNIKSGTKYFNVLIYENYIYNDDYIYLEQPEEIKANRGIRLQYGINCDLGEKVVLGLSTKLGYADMLYIKQPLLRCGLGGFFDDHYEQHEFNRIDVFELGMSIAYRL